MATDEYPAGPPLPDEAPPDDGWTNHWDPNTRAWYFHNHFTGVSTWDNPRIPEASDSYGPPSSTIFSGPEATSFYEPSSSTIPPAPGTSSAHLSSTSYPSEPPPATGGYNPKIHGDYDPNAEYARAYNDDETTTVGADTSPGAFSSTTAAAIADSEGTEEAAQYLASAHFNRFTGRFQDAKNVNPERHSDEAKAKRQLNAFYDADAQANSHDGKSLKAERQGKKLTRQEVRAYNEKRKKRKEEKRRAFFRD